MPRKKKNNKSKDNDLKQLEALFKDPTVQAEDDRKLNELLQKDAREHSRIRALSRAFGDRRIYK